MPKRQDSRVHGKDGLRSGHAEATNWYFLSHQDYKWAAAQESHILSVCESRQKTVEQEFCQIGGWYSFDKKRIASATHNHKKWTFTVHCHPHGGVTFTCKLCFLILSPENLVIVMQLLIIF